MKKRKIKELAVQNVLANMYREQGWGVRREVETNVGFIDLLVWKPKKGGGVEKCLIEVKERGGLKGAIGQVEMYSRYEKSDRLAIIYFSYDGRDRVIDDEYYSVKSYGTFKDGGQVIEIESVNRILDIGLVYAEQDRLDKVNEVNEVNNKDRVDIKEEEVCLEMMESSEVMDLMQRYEMGKEIPEEYGGMSFDSIMW
jgi:hypothetical protein